MKLRRQAGPDISQIRPIHNVYPLIRIVNKIVQFRLQPIKTRNVETLHIKMCVGSDGTGFLLFEEDGIAMHGRWVLQVKRLRICQMPLQQRQTGK